MQASDLLLFFGALSFIGGLWIKPEKAGQMFVVVGLGLMVVGVCVTCFFVDVSWIS